MTSSGRSCVLNSPTNIALAPRIAHAAGGVEEGGTKEVME
jgi:hypothetical protein